MKLTYEERHSALWVKLSKEFEERLSVLRQQNDGELDAIGTARLRGRIAELKVLMELGQPVPSPSDTDA